MVYIMGILKISDQLHDEVRKASTVMARSVNAQAEYWMKLGLLAELHPELTYPQLVQLQLQAADVRLPAAVAPANLALLTDEPDAGHGHVGPQPAGQRSAGQDVA